MQSLGEWLIQARLITQVQIDLVVGEQPVGGVLLASKLIDSQLVAEQDLVDVASQRLGLPKAPSRLYKQSIAPRILSVVPEDLCWQHQLIPFGLDRDTGRIQVAMTDPTDEESCDLLREILGQEPALYVVGPRQLEKAIRKHYMDSLIEETGKKRFFGYQNLTNPGTAPRMTLPANEPLETARPAEVPPAEEKTPLPEPALDSTPNDLGAMPGSQSSSPEPPAPEGAEAKPIRRIPTGLGSPATAKPTRLGRIAVGDDRLRARQRAEATFNALDELLQLLGELEDERIATTASQIQRRLRDAFDK
jgi:hypothetical protein